MNGLIFDDATCELVPAFVAVPPRRQRDYIDISLVPLPGSYITIESIKRAVCQHYGLLPIEMVSARRSSAVAQPRQMAMYLCRQLTPRSLPDIGRAFGGRDHSTVIHAVNVTKARLADNAKLRADHDAIIRALGE